MAINDLIPSAPTTDERGRFYSPFIERGVSGEPMTVPIPSLKDMKLLAPDELAVVAGRFGWQDTWDTRMEAMTGTLQSFGYDPSNPAAWNRAMDRMMVTQEKALLGVSRRLSQRYETAVVTGGDTNRMMIYVNESDEPCPECEALGGVVKTYAEFIADGDMPGDKCLGGNNCMCALMTY